MARGRWDWLYDLVHQRVGQSPEPKPSPTIGTDALRDALSRIGWSDRALKEGVAAVLGLSPQALMEPDIVAIRRSDPKQLGVLLPFLVHHEHAEIRAAGERWLACPIVLYQLPAPLLVRWLQTDVRIAKLIAQRLSREGLALVGSEALAQLAKSGCLPQVRRVAQEWNQRLA